MSELSPGFNPLRMPARRPEHPVIPPTIVEKPVDPPVEPPSNAPLPASTVVRTPGIRLSRDEAALTRVIRFAISGGNAPKVRRRLPRRGYRNSKDALDLSAPLVED